MEFQKACELSPEESEYQALYSWAMYCNAKDRAAVEADAIAKMASALAKGPMNATTRLYHAKLLKLIGRLDEASASFRILLEMSPGHREAELELRLLSKRQKPRSSSLFGRKR